MRRNGKTTLTEGARPSDNKGLLRRPCCFRHCA